MVKPISPNEVVKLKEEKCIPDFVISSFNLLIAKNWSGKSSSFTQNEIVTEILKHYECARQDVFSNKWLNVEDIYRKEGWKVEYDKPGYNETYQPTYTFTRLWERK